MSVSKQVSPGEKEKVSTLNISSPSLPLVEPVLSMFLRERQDRDGYSQEQLEPAIT